MAEAGIVPVQRTNDQAVAAALSGHRMAGLAPDERAEDMARKIVDGDLTADQAVKLLRAGPSNHGAIMVP